MRISDDIFLEHLTVAKAEKRFIQPTPDSAKAAAYYAITLAIADTAELDPNTRVPYLSRQTSQGDTFGILNKPVLLDNPD